MALSSQGTTLSFNGATFLLTALSARAPRPEIVNLTGLNGPSGEMSLAWTGDFVEPGSIEAEVFGFDNPAAMVGVRAQLTVSAPNGRSISGTAICTDAEAEAKVGDLLRSRLSFAFTTF